MAERNTRTVLNQELGGEWKAAELGGERKAAEKAAAAASNAKGYEEAEDQEEEGNEVEMRSRAARKVDERLEGQLLFLLMQGVALMSGMPTPWRLHILPPNGQSLHHE